MRGRHLIGIFLLGCLLAPAIGVYTLFHLRKTAIRRDVKARMMAGPDRGALVLLRLSKKEAASDLRWEQGREFEYRHRMYDIVSAEEQGDTVAYRCWPDDPETELNQQ